VSKEKDQTSRNSDLEDLDEKLRQARSSSKWAKDDGNDSGAPSSLGVAFRVATELVVSLVFGVGVGWALDRGLGTTPWLMLVGLFLGMAAGILNVYRVAMPKTRDK